MRARAFKAHSLTMRTLRRQFALPSVGAFLCFSIGAPLIGSAASGPQVPELTGYAEPGQQELVDLFTGDLRYTIPVFEVPGPNGGYPITLGYASGIEPDQEASWVGLGWTLNPGSIVRQMRGLPDEFAGAPDALTTVHDIEPNITFGLGLDGNLEIFGADPSVGLGISAGFKGYFNNYRGLGYTRSIGLSGQAAASGTSAQIGLNLSLDSQDGLRASPSLGLGDTMRFNADVDQYRGLTSFAVSAQTQYTQTSLDALSFLGYAKPTYIPTTGREMDGTNIQISFKFGASVQGLHPNLKPYGFFNLEKLKRSEVVTPAFGYLHLHEAGEDGALDFNREKEGPLYDRSPNLAVPVLTHDLYTVSGRDVSGTFRAQRNDVPVVFDPKQESGLIGGALGIEVGPGTIVHVGVNAALNGNSSVVKRWDGGDGGALLAAANAAFTDDPARERERTYFQFIGEQTPSVVPSVGGGTEPLALPLKASWGDSLVPPEFWATEPYFTDAAGTRIDPGQPAGTARAARAQVIQAVTFGELRSERAAHPEFPAPPADAIRKDHHIAGFVVTTQQGLRYVYGTAVYNTVHEEHKFSVDRADRTSTSQCLLVDPPVAGSGTGNSVYDYKRSGTEKFLEIKKLPPYATSYLLDVVLGPDYVDADDVPGPSDGDYGYWVRFNYEKDAQPFKWRSPYLGARFVRGGDNGVYVVGTERRGDKGFVTYGEREAWHLASIETASHRALFCANATSRPDAIGAASRSQHVAPDSGFARARRLDRIALYPKPSTATCATPALNADAVVTANLEYDQSLARGAPNHDPAAPAGARGKLTLKKLWYSHGTNDRGRLAPYEFDYEAGDAANNPVVSEAGRDRWDVYRTAPSVTSCPIDAPATDVSLAAEQPYTEQSAVSLDQWSAAWTLRRITEPTGRSVSVDFESDDYSYVQDAPATRMFRIRSANNGVFDAGASQMAPVRGGNAAHRVYFPLEAPLANADELRARYLEEGNQLYFRVRVALKDNSKWQTVTGYATVTGSGLATGANGEALGYVDLASVEGYHPFAVAAWQYLRLSQPELISDSAVNGDPAGDPFAEAAKVLTMVDFIEDIIAMARGLYPTWADDGWGQRLDLSQSWIRLRDPDGIKKGGGTRVRRIQVSDGWSASTGQQEADLVTGFTYRYRLDDGRSSGVAAFEPVNGGDENALRTAKPFRDEVLLGTRYNLFSELPIGESHYPSPVVGYARIERRSLLTESERAAAAAGSPPSRPTGSGPQVHEYYTARDFPLRQLETPVTKRRNPQPHVIPIPLLGMITLHSMTATQGYSAVLNDMHGKQKRIASYEYLPEFDAAAGEYRVRDEPVREETFVYRATGGVAGTSSDLASDLAVLTADAAGATARHGEQGDFVLDLHLNRTESWDAGVNVNTDVIMAGPFPIPIPVPMPNFGYSLAETKTAVSSRVVHRAGLLERVVLREGASRIETAHRSFDALTGGALLSTTVNSYGDPVYDYQQPARWSYPRMGPAYDDVGRIVPLAGAQVREQLHVTVPGAAFAVCPESGARPAGCLPLGTELAVDGSGGGARLTLTGKASDGTLTLQANRDVSGLSLDQGRVVRSGDRNLLARMTGRIRALSDPTSARGAQQCTWKERYPCGHCTIKESVDVPVCGLEDALTPDSKSRRRQVREDRAPGRTRACMVADFKWGHVSVEKGSPVAVLERSGERCRLLLLDGKGRPVPIEALQGPVSVVVAPAAGGARGKSESLSYTGLAVNDGNGQYLLYSDCGGFVGTTTRERTEVEYCEREQSRQFVTIRDVLDYSQETYRDDWSSVATDVRFPGPGPEMSSDREAFDRKDEFARGTRGAFRPWKEFLYVTERRQSPALDTRRDGTFDAVLFEGDGQYEPSCEIPWRWTREAMRYSPAGWVVEERSALGVPSASLYGSRGSLPIAVAVNANQDEIGFEGFEDYAADQPLVAAQTGEGNLTIYTRQGFREILGPAVTRVPVNARLYGAYARVESQSSVVQPGKDAATSPAIQWLSGTANGDAGLELRGVVVPGVPCPLPARVSRGSQGEFTLVIDELPPLCPEMDPMTMRGLIAAWRMEQARVRELEVVIGRQWTRRVRVPLVSVSSVKAHTGSKSLRVAANSQFEQLELHLEPGRRYVVSGWVSRDSTDVPTFAAATGASPIGLQVRIFAGASELTGSRPAAFEPSGPVIDGWQRIEGEFLMPAGADRIDLAYLSGSDSAGTAHYFDDVRVLPRDAGLQTFVYDLRTRRMLARLDDNNFAIFFGYAPDGTTELVRRETVRGILTERESRLHVRERP